MPNPQELRDNPVMNFSPKFSHGSESIYERNFDECTERSLEGQMNDQFPRWPAPDPLGYRFEQVIYNIIDPSARVPHITLHDVLWIIKVLEFKMEWDEYWETAGTLSLGAGGPVGGTVAVCRADHMHGRGCLL